MLIQNNRQNITFIYYNFHLFRLEIERVIAQADSRQFSTVAARVRSMTQSYGVCCGLGGSKTDFLRVLQLPLSISCPIALSSTPLIASLNNKKKQETYRISYLRLASVKRLACTPPVLSDDFCGFAQSLRANVRIVL
jgi:hypothetical protein